MRRVMFAVLGLLALTACSAGDQGGRDGRCDLLYYSVGSYRCTDNMVEICIAGNDPLRDPPEWYILADCTIPTTPGVHGACVMAADGMASCVRAQ